MRTLLLFLPLLLVGCNPFMVVTDDKIIASAGFMSKSQGFAGKAKTAHGSSASWSSVGADSTEVPNHIADTALGLGVADSTFKTVDSNNVAKTTQAKNASDAALALQKEKDAAAQAASDAAAKAASQAAARAAGAPALIK